MTALSNAQPYPGLRPYDSGDEEFFFGREQQTRGLRAKLDASRLVAVVGRSGCGKSSLVRAGLIPLLGKETDSSGRPRWHVATFRPQGRPIAELTAELLRLTSETEKTSAESRQATAEASTGEQSSQEAPPISPQEMEQLRRSRLEAMLRRSSQGLIEAVGEIGLPEGGLIIIIVDQFEEIFRFEDPSGSNTDEATAFVRLLTEAMNAESPGIHIILTMRLDFLGDCARFARLPEAISDGQFLVPNLSRAERRAAIEEPARKAGKQIRPGVTQRLLNDIGDDPDQLPVMQHVLMRMWQQAGAKDEITLEDYESTGGVATAISRHADQIYDRLETDTHRSAAARLFKAVSERDRRGRSIRRATPFGEIVAIVAGDDETRPAAETTKLVRQVIDAFRAPDCCFLMPPAEEEITETTLIDISHESLLRGWIKLTGLPGKEGWIAEEVADGQRYDDLRGDVKRNYVFPSEVAAERQQWWQTARPNAAWAQRYGRNFQEVKDFLQSVSDRHRRDIEIREGQKTRMRWLQRATVFTVILLIVTTIGFYYRDAVQRAEAQRRDAERERAAADSAVRLQRDYEAKLAQALNDQRAELNRIRSQLTQTAQQLPATDAKTREDLRELSSSLIIDATAQRPDAQSTASGTAAALTQNATGYMWIGSVQGISNLTTLSGDPVASNAVKIDNDYLTSLDIYLREAPPNRDTYAQGQAIGVMPDGTQIRLLSIDPPYSRSSGQQSWGKVRVTRIALPAVYFQFAGGSRDQAQTLSKALQGLGYQIPSEERTGNAAGRHEVRYFFAGQRSMADKLASDTNVALRRLGYPASLAVNVALNSTPTKSNTEGKLELWLEIPPR